MKHNKKRNTAFLYECLITELSERTFNKKDKKIIIDIIKEHFNKQSELYKELQLYKSLYEKNQDIDKEYGQRLLQEVKQEYSNIDLTKIKKEKDKIIDCINKQLGHKIYNNFVPNYKNLATIYQYFNRPKNVQKRIVLENKILEFLTTPSHLPSQPDIKTDNRVLKSFNKLYEEKYSKVLNESQKRLIQEYIKSKDENDLSLKVYLNEEVGEIKKKIQEIKTSDKYKDDKDMKEKYEQLYNLFEGYKKEKISKDMILKIMEVYEIIRDEQE